MSTLRTPICAGQGCKLGLMFMHLCAAASTPLGFTYISGHYANLLKVGQAAGVLLYIPAVAVPGCRALLGQLHRAGSLRFQRWTTLVLLCISSCVVSSKASTHFTHARRSKEQFVTEIAEVDYIFGNASMPFLKTVTQSVPGAFTFLQAVIYTPQVLPNSYSLA